MIPLYDPLGGPYRDHSRVYDPLVHAYPHHVHEDQPTYWQAISGPAPEDDGKLLGNRVAEVVIIGAGYTGLSSAIVLARDFGIKALVLEARSPASGCSGKNGSFARISGGRVPHRVLIDTYGEETAKAYFKQMQAGLATLTGLISEGQIDCDVQPDGVYKVAAASGHVQGLIAEAALYNKVYNYPARFVPASELHGVHNGQEAFGALYLPNGFSMNPLKLARGLLVMARKLGVEVCSNSPVISWQTDKDVHSLATPEGKVRTKRVIVATNGYTARNLHPKLASRILPVHSQIIVTAPLSEQQVRASLPSGKCMFDTRNLLFYYRRLPDNRILFGGRSAITGEEATRPAHRKYLENGLSTKFPVLSGVAVDYWWGGWVAVTRNSLPFASAVSGLSGVLWGGGYAGSGVSFSTQVGSKLAKLAAGKPSGPAISFLDQEPKRYPFPAFLRVGQRIAYRWLNHKDQSASK